jgi:glycosyltransferase involved in cell wall biosynthesis
VRSLASNRVKFLGHIDDQDVIKELHCNAFAYCHGHQFGGTNPALLKALAYGNLIFAMDTVFSREVLDDGKYGILIPKDAAKWAEQINYFEANENLAQPYRNHSRDRINELYTWEHITDEYEDVFKKLYAIKHK